MWLRDTGILKKLWADELNAPIHVPEPKVRVNEPLDVYQVGTAFIIEAGGLVLALLGFLLELCCSKSRLIKEGEKKEVFIIFSTIVDSTNCTYKRNTFIWHMTGISAT